MTSHNIKLYREVSAKTGNQVLDAFKSLGEILMSKTKSRNSEVPKMSLSQSKIQMGHPDNPSGVDKKKCC